MNNIYAVIVCKAGWFNHVLSFKDLETAQSIYMMKVNTLMLQNFDNYRLAENFMASYLKGHKNPEYEVYLDSSPLVE